MPEYRLRFVGEERQRNGEPADCKPAEHEKSSTLPPRQPDKTDAPDRPAEFQFGHGASFTPNVAATGASAAAEGNDQANPPDIQPRGVQSCFRADDLAVIVPHNIRRALAINDGWFKRRLAQDEHSSMAVGDDWPSWLRGRNQSASPPT